MVSIEKTEATRFTVALLQSAGASEANALIVATHLIESDLSGVASHGLMRVPQYIQEMSSGEIDGRAVPDVIARLGSSSLINGRRAFGQVGAAVAVREATTAADQNGIGLAAVTRAGHAGRIGAYVECMADGGYIGIAFCSGPRSGHRVAPFRGLEGRLSTNPIAFAFPAAEGSVVADFSTSVVPEGVVRRLRELAAEAPQGSLQDAQGTPTRDPNALYTDPPGTILPLGGTASGHKGYALGLLVESLTTVLAGEDPSDPSRFGNNLTLIAIPAGPAVKQSGTTLADYVRSSRAADPARPVLLPGDIERDARASARDRIRIDGPVWTALTHLAARHELPLPKELA